MCLNGKKEFTYIQCQTCGEIYQIQRTVPIDKLYVVAECPVCGEVKGLNLGEDKEDIYYFYNTNLDYRHYNY